MQLPVEAKRLKEIREELGFTQSQFAHELGLNATTADLERGRVKIPGFVVKELYKKFQINPLWLFGETENKRAVSEQLAPMVVTVDNTGMENILMVNEKAAAGYANNLGDPEFYENLPAFTFPLPEFRNASFRGFQIIGDSMYPDFKPGEWVLAKAVDSFTEIKKGKIYVVVEDDSIRLKQVIPQNNLTLQLISLNPEYPTTEVSLTDVKEIWQFHSKLSFENHTEKSGPTLAELYKEVKEIKRRLK